MLTEAEKELILSLIDSGSWKHSWHLPQTKYGHVDWSNPSTIKTCLAVVVEMKAEAIQMIRRIESIDMRLVSELNYLNAKIEETNNPATSHRG